MKTKNLLKHKFKFKETNCTILSDSKFAIETAISAIKHHRRQLDLYVRANPKFLYSFKPVSVENGPKIVTLMAEHAYKAGVGPMAAVAGVLADLAVEEMWRTGCEVAVVENGGEVAAVSNKHIDAAFLAGDHPLSKRFGFRLEEFPIGIATSSGLFSHAISFGEAEATTIFAINAGLADAAATAVGNLMKGNNHQEVMERGIQFAVGIEGVKGVLIVYRNNVGIGGKVPKFIKFTTS